MADGYIQVPSDSVGKKVDAAELTRSDGVLVERQRVVHPDAITVSGDVLEQILVELRLINQLLAMGFNVTDNLDNFRNDLTPEINAPE